MALVYSTDHGRTCPGCRQSLTGCICKAARPIPAGDGIVRVSREKQGRGGKTVTVLPGLMLDATALTSTGKQLHATCGAGGTDHSQLEGVADGKMAVDAYLEATDPDTSPQRIEELRRQLLTYCRLDTWAMVRLWAFLVGRPEVVEGEAVRALPDPQH